MIQTLKTRTGVIVNFGTRGFGFLVDLETSQEIFFHVRDWRGVGVPRPGDAVTYLPSQGSKGARAYLVTPDGGDK